MNIRIATEAELASVYALRLEVFVDEQQVPPELELDEDDRRAWHILAEEKGVTVGCARILFDQGSAHLGRIAVKRTMRAQGIGSAVVRYAIALCRQRGCTEIGLHAQLHAVGFYEALGFRSHGEPFTEAGIAHIAMTLSA